MLIMMSKDGRKTRFIKIILFISFFQKQVEKKGEVCVHEHVIFMQCVPLVLQENPYESFLKPNKSKRKNKNETTEQKKKKKNKEERERERKRERERERERERHSLP
jgi:hypothetical protein